MKRRVRRSVDIFNLSFLDVVSCGFGAIILLLVIVKVSEPAVIEKQSVDLSGLVLELEQQLHDIRGETRILDRSLQAKQEQLSQHKQRLARLQGDLSAVRGEHKSAKLDSDAQSVIGGELESAKQKLSEEMRRLLGAQYRRPAADVTIGGVPVDSEYVIFILDTSGSMNQHAWPLVLKKVSEVLRIYPKVKGIQVMNDMGDYLFSNYQGKWIPDSKARRKAIIKRLAGWAPFSNSSPVEGIEAAIKRFHARDKRISLYVFGDDFSRGSIEQVIETVARLNRSAGSGKKRVRIHAVGFPVQFQAGGLPANAVRYAALMRKLAENNDGSFVGLTSVRP